jgi:AbrB family looped-hinge helix DNA binding protein
VDFKGDLYRPRVFGSATVSPKGQVVIPANARKELGIGSGDTLLVCGPPHGQGLLLLKVDTVEQILSSVGEQLVSFGKLVSDYRSPKAADKRGQVS